MTEQEALEQAAKPQRWGSKERVALVAEVLRQKRFRPRRRATGGPPQGTSTIG